MVVCLTSEKNKKRDLNLTHLQHDGLIFRSCGLTGAGCWTTPWLVGWMSGHLPIMTAARLRLRR